MTASQANREDFKVLYQNTYGILVNFVYSKTKDWDLSKEIVQNTFVRFWRKREEINIRNSEKSYLFSMVRNGIIDHYRKEQNKTDLDEVVRLDKFHVEQDIEKEQISIEIKYYLKKSIESLKDKRKEIFELSKFEGLTYKEIAKHMQISERSVEDNIAKAFKHIRKYFIDNNLIYLWNK